MVEILLGRDDVDPSKPSEDGETLLWLAAKNGHQGVIEILFGRGDVDPNKPSEDGETLLWWAAKDGHHGVVEILLGRDDVDPNKPNEDGETLLWSVFATVRGPRRARQGDCQEPWTGRDGRMRSTPVLETSGRPPLWRTAGPAR